MDWDVRSGASAPARDLLHGCVELEECPGGWVRPQRFSAMQRRALSSCLAWYPGIFRQMATCTAGVRLEFETDATQVLVEFAADTEPRATRNVLKGMKPEVGDAIAPHDGLSVDVDGKHLPRVVLAPDVAAAPGEAGPGVLLDLGGFKSRGNLVQLPGFGDMHRVRVWLPSLRGCELRRVYGNGSFVRPVSGEAPRGTLLVLGDSVAQGFTVGDPALAWPSLVADELQYGLVNQSVGAQVFQESSLGALPAGMDPSLMIVALGANYRYGRCNARVTGREIASYLARADELWPSVPLVVIVPAKQPGREAVRGSCYECVGDLIDEAAARVRRRRLAASAPAVMVLRAPALPEDLLSDEDGHPTAAGAALLARFVCSELPKLSCQCLRETGRFGRCGACAGTGTLPPVAFLSQSGGGAKKRGGRKAKATVAAAIEPKPEAAPVLANVADTEAEATSVSTKVEAAKPTKSAPVSAKVAGDEPVKPARVSANKPTRRAAAVEDTPVGQTISMFTLLDE